MAEAMRSRIVKRLIAGIAGMFLMAGGALAAPVVSRHAFGAFALDEDLASLVHLPPSWRGALAR